MLIVIQNVVLCRQALVVLVGISCGALDIGDKKLLPLIQQFKFLRQWYVH